nr:hypothetical protein Iba_chr09eCG14480 [Ipomoea batatas]
MRVETYRGAVVAGSGGVEVSGLRGEVRLWKRLTFLDGGTTAAAVSPSTTMALLSIFFVVEIAMVNATAMAMAIRDGNDDDIEVCMNMMETTAATASSAADATRNDGSHRSFSLRGPTVLSILMFTAICITCGKTPPPPLSGGDSLPELTPADPVSYVSRLSSRREVMPFPALQELTLQAAFLAISQRSSSTKSCWLPPVSFPSSSPSDESAIEFTLLGWTLLL